MACSNNDTLATRFLAKVNKAAGCWLWTGHFNPNGYGMIAIANGKASAHRVSYELNVAPIPPGMWVLHGCDNPKCVNPEHLRVGTCADNTNDRVARGRSKNLSGEAHARSKLSNAGVQIIRTSPLPLSELSRIFGVAKSAISKVQNNKAWRHV